MPITFAAASGSRTPGSWIAIWSLPCFVIAGSATPSLSTRLAHDRHRAVEIRLLERLPLGRHRLQRHLETALEIEAERRLLVDRRARDAEQRDADESRDDGGRTTVALRRFMVRVRLDRVWGIWLVTAQLRRPNSRFCVASRPASARSSAAVAARRRTCGVSPSLVASSSVVVLLVVRLHDGGDAPPREPNMDPLGDLDDQVAFLVDRLDDAVEPADGEHLVTGLRPTRAAAAAAAGARAAAGSCTSHSAPNASRMMIKTSALHRTSSEPRASRSSAAP